jgi:sulfoxide reductase catalytic subunit YedY
MNWKNDIPAHEITSPEQYHNRRKFLSQAGILVGSAFVTGALYRSWDHAEAPKAPVVPLKEPLAVVANQPVSDAERMAQGYLVNEEKTSLESISTYNNFYEFTTRKEGVAALAAGFKTHGWQLKVDGLVDKPQTFNLDQLRELFPLEERVYRMRCVEAWSMVIPWNGFQLSKLLEKVQPQSTAKYVAFETLYDPERMPGQKKGTLDWPYVEGLGLNEAMHPLTILAMGIYGQQMPPQDGAPIRLVVPWKYGFKGIKSIVGIKLVDHEPPCTWSQLSPHEYGFLANVNPTVDHPRWSQATEQRIGESGRRKTLMFNGYEEHVASLYKGLDLSVHF